MAVLVIDDLRCFPFDAKYARNAVDGLALLASRAWDEVWLDHDLGDGVDIGPVVDLLCERAVWGDPMPVGRIVVHSANPPASEQMVRVLARHYTVLRVDAAAQGGHVPS